jgi:hypothetical protein
MSHEIEKLNEERVQNGLAPIVIGITGCMVRKTGLHKKYLSENIERNKAKKIEYIENEK